MTTWNGSEEGARRWKDDRGSFISKSPGSQNKYQPTSSSWKAGSSSPTWNPKLSPQRVETHVPPSDQLANLKNQWNVNRDIPSGTVRNNAFIPKREPVAPPSPQLSHQKKQWDTDDIPRGSVASRAFMIEGGEKQETNQSKRLIPSPRQFNSPNRRQFPASPSHGKERRIQPPSSPGQALSPSTGQGRPGFFSLQPYTKISLRDEETQPTKQPSNRQHLISSPYARWKTSVEVPKETVKGRVSSPFGQSATPFNTTAPIMNKLNKTKEEEDLFIIPQKTRTVFPGERNISVKSSDSEDWDNSANDWLQSQTWRSDLGEDVDDVQVVPPLLDNEEKKFDHDDIFTIKQKQMTPTLAPPPNDGRSRQESKASLRRLLKNEDDFPITDVGSPRKSLEDYTKPAVSISFDDFDATLPHIRVPNPECEDEIEEALDSPMLQKSPGFEGKKQQQKRFFKFFGGKKEKSAIKGKNKVKTSRSSRFTTRTNKSEDQSFSVSSVAKTKVMQSKETHEDSNKKAENQNEYLAFSAKFEDGDVTSLTMEGGTVNEQDKSAQFWQEKIGVPPPPPPPRQRLSYEQAENQSYTEPDPELNHIDMEDDSVISNVPTQTSHAIIPNLLQDRVQESPSRESDEHSKKSSSSSIKSDIRVLRTILRRPRQSSGPKSVIRPSAQFKRYDIDTTDPLQRAGLKLLSAAIIPIQTEIRRFLALRRAMTRMWGLIVIQAYARKWLAKKRHVKSLKSVVKIQAVIRGALTRDYIDYKHVCAIEIQRVMRGYLATMTVYEDIYRVTIVQNAWRKRAAIDKAAGLREERLHTYAALTVQKAARVFLAKKYVASIRKDKLHDAATKIQSSWRGFIDYADYMLTVADIITVQKLARGWLARRETNKARQEAATTIQKNWRQLVVKINESARISNEIAGKESRAATAIQTFLRCITLRNAYRYYKAALVIQSNFRGMKARQDVMILRGEILAATLIQSAWRGFVSYTDYVFTIADVIMAQKVARGYMDRKKHKQDLIEMKKKVRVEKGKIGAARLIQNTFRGFIVRQNYWYTLGCTVQVQSWMRGRLVILQQRREQSAALKLQCTTRCWLARQQILQKKFILALVHAAKVETSRNIATLVNQEMVQSHLESKKREEAARIIQRFFLMVKLEVDQMLRLAKRRKKWRKRVSQNQQGNVRLDDEDHDFLLENAWGAVNEKKDRLPTSYSISSKQLPFPRKILYPHPRKDNDQSLYAQLTGSTCKYYRVPPARMQKMNSTEMDEDFKLEVAYIDVEISSARSRRMVQNHNMKRVM